MKRRFAAPARHGRKSDDDSGSDRRSYDSSDYENIMHVADHMAARSSRDDEAREHEIEAACRLDGQPIEENETVDHDQLCALLEMGSERLTSWSTSLPFATVTISTAARPRRRLPW